MGTPRSKMFTSDLTSPLPPSGNFLLIGVNFPTDNVFLEGVVSDIKSLLLVETKFAAFSLVEMFIPFEILLAVD